jgi:RIO kinase 1
MTTALEIDEALLDAFIGDGSITDVLYVVRSGKEATVYCCRGSAEYGGGLVALANKSRHGRDLQYGRWIHAEFEIMQMLYEAGADVPEVFGRSSGAILMEYLGDEDAAAPMLSRVTLPREQAEQFLRRIIDNVTLWLRNHLVHGDLSPYNLLYWEGRIVAIDFPQALDARINPSARSLLGRDLENVCGYFGKYGIRADAVRIANALWANYQAGRL